MPAIYRYVRGIDKNLAAFLDMLAWSELQDWILESSDNGYNVIVMDDDDSDGRLETFSDYSDHPFANGRPAERVRPGLYSTAAGRYQFLLRYWPHYKRVLNLPDFGPVSQDKWAIRLIREQRAFPFVVAGHIPKAISMCSNIWASLPGAGYGQPEHKLTELLERFEKYRQEIV